MTFHSDLWSLELLGSSPACLRQLLHGFLLYLVDAGAAFSQLNSFFMDFHYVFWSLVPLWSTPVCLRQLLHAFLLYLLVVGAAVSVKASSTPSWISTVFWSLVPLWSMPASPASHSSVLI
jgi:hypothetical protein